MRDRRGLFSLIQRIPRDIIGLGDDGNLDARVEGRHPPLRGPWAGDHRVDISGLEGHRHDVDPFRIMAQELDEMSQAIFRAVSVTQHPVLNRAASYFFEASMKSMGKRVRPTIVFLMAHATLHHAVASGTVDAGNGVTQSLLDTQRRLAGITEMLHTASLLHDDVIDVSDTRRGLESVNSVFGNQLAVLAGDFLLARASIGLAQLRNCDVVELLSTVIEHLVRGEILQMHRQNVSSFDVGFPVYLRKTFFKTASLIANSCQASAMLALHPPEICHLAFEYGRNLGMAFQLVDDALDLRAEKGTLGKPVGADLEAGVITAPVLYALEAYPQLAEPITRRFAGPGDIEYSRRCIEDARGVDKTMALATRYAQVAVGEASRLAPSDYRSALINLADAVLTRSQ
eukprot:CAMPEP_0184678860 /NCGR_PEP_ID=MMETSP0312-20130426/1671_1 /TAXON_ID=31354 /ORGANISM="Compsopogon coeruleus, Strain SAG 36.94" /LENGTH=399 /DNA_ID=CAMNT_0027127927 /DNA_START=323 /DNA_END=1522 /DNA_ORIENTATION=+